MPLICLSLLTPGLFQSRTIDFTFQPIKLLDRLRKIGFMHLVNQRRNTLLRLL